MFAKRPKFIIKTMFARLKGSRLASKMASGVFWLSVGSVPSRIAMLITTCMVVRILGQYTYGEFTLVRSTVNAFITVASFGMGRTSTKYVSELLVTDRDRVGRIIALNYVFTIFSSVAVAIVFCIAAPWMCDTLIEAPHLVLQTRLSSLLLILTALVGAQTGVLTGFQSYKEIAYSLSISGFASIPFFWLGARFGGLTGAILGASAAPLFNCLCNSFYIHRRLRRGRITCRYRECWREIGVLWNFCLPATLVSMLMSFVTWGASVMLARQPNGTSELGVFDVARQVQTAVLYFPVLAANVVVPSLSELNALKDADRYEKTVRCNVILNAIFTLTLALFLIPFSKMIMRTFGDDFVSGAGTLVILLILSVVMSVSNVYTSALTSLGELWTKFWLTVVWSVIVLGALLLNGYWLPGAIGLAVAMLCAYLVQTLGMKICIMLHMKRTDLSKV